MRAEKRYRALRAGGCLGVLTAMLALGGCSWLPFVKSLPEAPKESALAKDWTYRIGPGDTVNIGIGQGDILVTPLQLASAVSIIANRGKVIPPRMLKTRAKR